MRFRTFVVARDSDVEASTLADEQWWFECACTIVFPLEKGADNHDITM